MSDVMIQVDRVSKKFCKSMKRSMVYGLLDISRNLAGLSSRPGKLRKNEFWAVEDVSFQLKRGETLGIIGPNGAGKSTVLKMLNGIYWPDKGKIVVNGRVGALIEVGAGFHPMLTGRENIYVNGAVLGMNKEEITSKFDQIVDFADIGEFLDTPVKNYSSGMFVRLGFAIAIHSNPDILLVDEILSVGDLGFQAKSRKRIRELMEQDVSIVLVSHNVHTISDVCQRVMVVNKSHAEMMCPPDEAIDFYRSMMVKKDYGQSSTGEGVVRISGFQVLDAGDNVSDSFAVGDFVKCRLHFQCGKIIRDPVFNIAIYNSRGEVVSGIRTDVDRLQTGVFKGDGTVDLVFEQFNLLPDVYFVNATIFDSDGYTFLDRVEHIGQLKITGGHDVQGTVFMPHQWKCN
jgi:lipopolysaccharide transport system ATP-binding protein